MFSFVDEWGHCNVPVRRPVGPPPPVPPVGSSPGTPGSGLGPGTPGSGNPLRMTNGRSTESISSVSSDMEQAVLGASAHNPVPPPRKVSWSWAEAEPSCVSEMETHGVRVSARETCKSWDSGLPVSFAFTQNPWDSISFARSAARPCFVPPQKNRSHSHSLWKISLRDGDVVLFLVQSACLASQMITKNPVHLSIKIMALHFS